MSSTNRSKGTLEARKEANDHFVTPQWAIREFLRDWNRDTGYLEFLHQKRKQHRFHEGVMPPLHPLILDPCAGGDNDYPAMSYPTVLEEYGFNHGEEVMTIDIREDSRAMVKTDYLTYELEVKPELIITNPPFYLALEIIEKSLHDVQDYGFVVMLLRLNFFGSQKRLPWFRKHMPLLTYVHSKRMGFYPDKPRKTDSIEYMHAIWQKNVNPDHTELRIIESK